MKKFLSIFCCILCFSVTAQAIDEINELVKASKMCDLQTVQKLLDNGVNINQYDLNRDIV